jgi:peptidoglycan/LPS O-acetylase OafA/YrhL
MTLQERLVETSFRGPGFDLIRFVAATFVLLHHCRGIEYADIRVDPLFHYSGGFIHFGFLAVLVFFVIGGFLVTPSLLRSENMVDFALRRIIRIFPALIVVVIASMVVLGPILTNLTLSSYFSDPQLYYYAKNVLTLTYDYLPGVINNDGHPIMINGPLWILHFLVLSYAALALTAMLGLLRRRSQFMILFLASYGIYFAMSFDPTLVALLPDRLLTFIKLFVYFGAGATLFIFADCVPFSIAFAIGAFALVVAALPFGFGAVVMPLCFPYIIVFCGLSALPGRRLLKHDLSYGVYLIHSPILVAVSLFFSSLRIWWLAAVIVFFVTLVLSYLCWAFVEVPAMRRKKGLSNWLNGRVDAFCSAWSKRKPARVPTNK